AKGLFYGIQTLRQLSEVKGETTIVPAVEISDYARFGYRGLHLDVSRHFYPVSFIKKHLNALAYYKMNTFHWHLTDGAAWRLQMTKYPELTQKGAWRKSPDWKTWWTGDRKYAIEGEADAFGGYYTHADVKDILDYASKRYITVIPEIEMPGHSEEVLAVYPELSCTGQPYKHGEFCPGNEAVFTFLQNVLDEVIELFPSEYIHIGGDEAAKGAWKECPKCQQRIRDEKLKDEEELQSYFVHRIERYLNSKGRKMIGWDEILEGGLSKTATVMSWRGEEGGIKAAKAGNEVIMTPGEYCYLDQYQDNPMTEPEAIGGYLPLKNAYAYDPLKIDLTDAEKKLIRGIQGNVWTEYMSTVEITEQRIYPRLLALCEVAWSNPEVKDWSSFRSRVSNNMAVLNQMGISAKPLTTIITQEREIDLENKIIRVSLSADLDSVNIRYTTDGSEPSTSSLSYTTPIEFRKTTTLKAQIFKNGKAVSDVQSFAVDIHKGLGRPIEVSKYLGGYAAGGKNALVDGQIGTFSYRDQKWQGYVRRIESVVDLGESQEISEVRTRFMQLVGPWIWLPTEVQYLVSDDNVNFTPIATLTHDVPENTERMILRDFTFKGSAKGRYVKMLVKPVKTVGAVMFVDELVIN
ncbi:MAG: glycoside hydrolase family 20 protein, partial [Bacteroidales bacterium]